MQRLSSMIVLVVLGIFVCGVAQAAADHLNRCGLFTLPGTGEIVCLCQFEDSRQASDLDNTIRQIKLGVEPKLGEPCDPSNLQFSATAFIVTTPDTTASTAFVSTVSSTSARPTTNPTATPEKELRPEGFRRNILSDVVDGEHHHHTAPAPAMSPPTARSVVRYTKDSVRPKKIRLFGGLGQRPAPQ